MMFERRAFVLCLLFAAAQAWELPAFMLEGLPSMEEISAATSSSTVKMEGLFPGVLAEPHQRREAEKNNGGENSEAPTDTPTESPAPSPSPSETPTEAPTVTGKPTAQPTELPTESPAPSPSPSETPTLAPSDSPSSVPTAAPTVSPKPTGAPSPEPSSAPSDVPSLAPSPEPTVSMMPSRSPSVAPSSAPSSVPTVSMMPSLAPSTAPSTSPMPSTMPTHLSSEAGSFTAKLPLETTLNETQALAFETATMEFISNDIVPATGDLSEALVKVTSQSVVEIDKNDTARRRQRRELMNFNDLDIAQQLVVEFTAAATYAGTDVEFDFAALLDHEFHSENPAWLRRLAQKDAIFDDIVPEKIKKAPEDGETSKNVIEVQGTGGKNGVSSGGIAAATVLSISAMMIGVAAVVYAVKSHKENVYGRELESTGGSSALMKSQSTSSGSRIVRENQAEVQRQFDAEDDDAVSWKADSAATPLSPNSLEQGKSVSMNQIMKSSPKMTQQSIPLAASRESVGSGWDHIISAASNMSHNSASGRAKDPPSSSNVATSKPEARNMASLFDNNTEMSEPTDLTKPRTSENFQPANLTRNFFSNPITTAGYESEVTRGMQTINITPKSASGNSATDFPKKSESIDRMEHNAEQFEERTTPELSRHAGLYDVFAPAGPIGIVVDTTKNGPAVHSLKRTSPMLGLINAGDLIVALDDEDTRGMTAATLTRLMARKSSQKERKITLLTSETY